MSGAARQRIDELCEAWRLSLRRVSATSSSFVAFGTRRDVPIVLKVARRRHDEWNAGAVLSAFEGSGMVRALEHEPGAVLLEHARPGTRLVTRVGESDDEEALGVLASVIRRMQSVDPDPRGHPTAAALAEGFDRYRAVGADRLPAELVDAGQEAYLKLCETQRRERLLHGDLHHGNVLFDRERGWLAIDPKGVVAEPEFELGAALRNPEGSTALHTRAALRARADRYARLLDVDASRVVRWAFAQAVLSTVWMIEDGEPVGAEKPMIAIARALRALATPS